MMDIIDRLKEPSSMASLSAIFTMLGLNGIAEPISYVVAGVAGIAGFFMKEKKA